MLRMQEKKHWTYPDIQDAVEIWDSITSQTQKMTTAPAAIRYRFWGHEKKCLQSISIWLDNYSSDTEHWDVCKRYRAPLRVFCRWRLPFLSTIHRSVNGHAHTQVWAFFDSTPEFAVRFSNVRRKLKSEEANSVWIISITVSIGERKRTGRIVHEYDKYPSISSLLYKMRVSPFHVSQWTNLDAFLRTTQ